MDESKYIVGRHLKNKKLLMFAVIHSVLFIFLPLSFIFITYINKVKIQYVFTGAVITFASLTASFFYLVVKYRKRYLVSFKKLYRRMRQRETELKRAEQMFVNSVLEHPELVCCFDKNGEITIVNRSFSALFNLQANQIKGSFFSPVTGISEEWDNSFLDDISRENCVTVFNHPFVRSEDEVLWFEWSVRAVSFSLSGQILAYKATGTDITDKKEFEDKSRKDFEELLQADKMISLGTLVSGVAHEINNPNNSILLNIQIFLRAWPAIEDILDEYYKSHTCLKIAGLRYERFRDKAELLLRGILESSDRIQVIVDDLKNFSKRDTGDNYSPVSLNSVVRSVLNLLEGKIRNHNVELVLDLEEDLPLVTGNFHNMEQVLINLFLNAVFAVSENNGNIELETYSDPDKDQVFIRIKDSGKGISAENMKRIRDPFFTTRRGNGGTGLGLFICERILTQHKGNMQIVSVEGSGTSVEISLPVRRGEK